MNSSVKEFDQHRLVSFFYDPATSLRGYIAIHRGNGVIPSFGATRMMEYASEDDALKDTLKLSRIMSYKAALAGLRYGGAKGVIISGTSVDPRSRKRLLRAYAEKVNCLGGRFITGADVGITATDVRVMSAVSRFFVGVKSDPVRYTALGLLQSIEVCLEQVFGSREISGRSFAIQGVGKIGTALTALLYPRAARIYISDIDPEQVKRLHRRYKKVRPVDPAHIHRQPVDVFSPCALAYSLNVRTINQMQCPIICGGANNQLENKHIGGLLYKLGILYAPDYVVNAGGLISVVDEYEHKAHSEARVKRRLDGVVETLKRVLRLSKRFKKPTNLVADEMAERIFNNHM